MYDTAVQQREISDVNWLPMKIERLQVRNGDGSSVSRCARNAPDAFGTTIETEMMPDDAWCQQAEDFRPSLRRFNSETSGSRGAGCSQNQTLTETRCGLRRPRESMAELGSLPLVAIVRLDTGL